MNAAAAALVVLNGRQAFDPRASLFAHNEPGFWYDPSDLSSMYQDSAGTTPVTAVEQAVGLVLDKSKGLVIGPELVTNGDFSSGTGWTTGGGWAIGSGVATATSTSTTLVGSSYPVVAGRGYRVEFDVVTITGGTLFVRVGQGTAQTFTTTGRKTCILYSTNTTGIEFYGGTVSCSIDNVSVREIAGNHAIQPGATNRPILRSRYNLLERSEEFGNAYWTKTNTTVTADAGVAPNGTTTADLLYPTTTGTDRFVFKNVLATNNTGYTVSVYAKASGKSFLYFATLGGGSSPASLMPFFDLTAGQVAQAGTYFDAVTIQAVGNGWYRCTATKNTVTHGANQFPVYGVADANNSGTATTNGTDGILIWGADLRSGNDIASGIPSYQRIAAATDYDTVGFPVYLAFDGSDDSLYTGGNVDFSATDKMTVWAGVTKLADPSFGTIAELTADLNSNNGAFYVAGAVTASSVARSYAAGSKGTTGQLALMTDNSLYPAPVTNVLTMQGDISGDSVLLYVDRLLAASGTGDQGTGNFANAPLYIGRRNNASLPFNGRLYQLIGRGAATSAALLSQADRWVAGKQGRAL